MSEINAIDQKQALKTFAPWKIFLAIFLGLGISGYMLYNDIQKESDIFQSLSTLPVNYFWLFMAFLVMVLRDVGYVYRIKTITEGEFTLKASIYTILLWEFASAVTPSVVGGTLVAVFIMNKEGLSFGKSLSYVMLTAMLDNLFFIVFGPLVILLVGTHAVDVVLQNIPYFDTINLFWLFSISYALIAAYTLLMAWGLFISPNGFRRTLFWFTKFKLLKRLRKKAAEQGLEIVIASQEIKGKSRAYWIKIILSTIFIWSARYLVVNCLLAAFTDAFEPGTGHTHLEAYAKQVVLWIAQLVSVTPGGSGLAEYFFKNIYAGFAVGWVLTSISILWRFITYYPYLITGTIILPRWLKRVLAEKPEKQPVNNID